MATAHVFIVDYNTFKYHLEYLFAGTGAGNKVIDFNNVSTTTLHAQSENNLVGMIADINRIRVNDYVLFYLQQNYQMGIYEGKFYGIFKVIERRGFIDNNDSQQFLKNELQKSLTFRILLQADDVYADGVTEWEALDEISSIQSPNQMLWSLIYRKLKGNRGNTMITIYEFDRIKQLIRNKNNRNVLTGNYFTFNTQSQKIESCTQQNRYTGRQSNINLLPRLINKYSRNLQFEIHLQAYILQNLENITPFSNEQIEWIGNEVSCGVGMQRIDIMLSTVRNTNRVCIPIELKSTEAYLSITTQLQRYVDWIQQYYLPNRPSDLEPMIISRKISNKTSQNYLNLVAEFNTFNRRNNLQLRYVEFDIITNNINFVEVIY
ncbi:DUF91 domain-containing protein [Sulfurimonas marina]|uniref:DUF91 domain-containing protein n=2 Tax=Sulfurimonas marina TaxID=2590551 RepID=A0A7M1AY67_9BACT|nr:DUF91 domain-containing protein [Sulfurimonas marina]